MDAPVRPLLVLFVLTEVVQLLEINTHNVFPTLERTGVAS